MEHRQPLIVAVIAASITVIAALIAAYLSISAAKKKDRSLARSLSTGIAGEINHLKQNINRVRPIIQAERQYDAAFDKHANPEELRRNIQIVDPPIVKENSGQLNILGKAGSILLELLSLTSEHNRLVATTDPTTPLWGLLGERQWQHIYVLTFHLSHNAFMDGVVFAISVGRNIFNLETAVAAALFA